MRFEINHPLLLLFIPILALFLLWSVGFLRVKEPLFQRKIAIVRTSIIGLLLLAMSGVFLVKDTQKITTIFLIDVSDSMNGHQKEEEQFVRDAIKTMGKYDEVGVIAFGEEALVDQFVSEHPIFDTITTEPITTSTNYENAIAKALSMFEEESGKRIVLLTDGYGNDGNLLEMRSSLVSQQVEFQVKRYEQEKGEEVYISDLDVPEKIGKNETFQITVTVYSTIETEGKIQLYSGREWRGEKEVIFQKGENQFVFQDKESKGGLKTYRAVVEAKEDTTLLNNEYSAFTDVTMPTRVLIVEGERGNGTVLEQILKDSGFQYDMVSPASVPDTISKMTAYKTILLNNVMKNDLKTGFLDNLDTYVKDYAGGLVAIGGDSSFALGGYSDTVLEKVLPVHMHLKGEKEIPKVSMVMVIDHSGSMTSGEGANNLDLAKQSAISAVDTLRDSDEVGVLGFDDRFQWIVPIGEIQDKESIMEKIATIEEGGGTSIYPALKEAVEQLVKSDAKLKHVILLTDGQDGFHDYDDVIVMANKENITISTVAIGDDADQRTLKEIADQGAGRYYSANARTNLPKIFSKEVYLSMRDYIIEREFVPEVVSEHEILDGVKEFEFPKMLGYVGASAKNHARVLLESDTGDPILTVWQYGLGKTVAWQSDATNQWTSSYANWEPYTRLWKQIIDETVAQTDTEEDFMKIETKGDVAFIHYTTDQYSENTEVTVLCTDEKGEQQTIALKPSSPGNFSGSFSMGKEGVTTVRLVNKTDGAIVSNKNGVALKQYSKEYRLDGEQKELLQFMQEVDGKEIKEAKEVLKDMNGRVEVKYPLYSYFVFLSMLLFLWDIAIRRFHLTYLEDTIKKRKELLLSKKENMGKKREGVKEQHQNKKREEQERIREERKENPKKKQKKEQEVEALDVQTLLKEKKKRNGL